MQTGDGREIAFFPSRSPSSFEVGQKRDLLVAARNVLLLRANARGFVNGERVQVKAIKKGRIALGDGRELPAGYRTLSHGYAVTSQAAQGKTVDEVLLVASSRSFAAVSQESFYVGISRARDRARIFTDDAELLDRRVEDSHSRKAAVELDGLRDVLAKAGFKRASAMTPEPPRASAAQSLGRAWRATRTLRVGRLAPAQRVAQWAHSFRHWLDVRLGVGIELTQRAALRPETMLTQRPDPPRQSHGIRM